jgi:hypothetical protein
VAESLEYGMVGLNEGLISTEVNIKIIKDDLSPNYVCRSIFIPTVKTEYIFDCPRTHGLTPKFSFGI